MFNRLVRSSRRENAESRGASGSVPRGRRAQVTNCKGQRMVSAALGGRERESYSAVPGGKRERERGGKRSGWRKTRSSGGEVDEEGSLGRRTEERSIRNEEKERRAGGK
ncbi:hypothetical protein KM043_002312 [Ampulex compressa]|nr:hypothetical protein KM043_002312 [Ampulex compressa]